MKLISIAALILAFLPVGQGSTGIIEGIVLRKDSRTALSGVRIGIEEGFPSRTLRTPFFTDTLTDGSGQFTVRNVPVGEFDITASLQGYLGQAHAKVVVSAGQRIQVALELTKGSTIRGQVIDSEEHAVASVRVEALQQYTDELGHRRWDSRVASGTTNSNGEYSIPTLAPGSYYLRTVKENQAEEPDIEPTIRETVYFPGTADPNVAASLVVGESADVIADIRIPRSVETATFNISGRLVHSFTGISPYPLAGVNLIRRDRTTLDPTSIPGKADAVTGRFEILGVPPGDYELLAGITVGQNKYFSLLPINVRAQDIEDLAVHVSPGVDVKAHIVVDDARQEFAFSGIPASVPVDDALRRRRATNIRVRLTGKDFHHNPNSIVSESGSEMTFPSVPEGTYEISVGIESAGAPLNPDSYIDDVRVAGRSVYDSGLRVGLDPMDSVEIAVGTRGGSIEGTIPRKGKAGAIVILIPDSFRRNNSGLYKREAIPASDDKVRIRGIAPGNYRIFAVLDTVESLPFRSSEFAARYESRAVPVTIQKGATIGPIEIPLLPLE